MKYRKIIDYQLIEGDSFRIQIEVNKALKHGWEILGPPKVLNLASTIHIIQAMVKYEQKPKAPVQPTAAEIETQAHASS